MNRVWSAVAAALVSTFGLGCAGNALMQSAKPPAAGSTTVAVSTVWTNNDFEESDSDGNTRSWRWVGLQVDYRIGVGRNTDIGIGTFLMGARVDAKHDFADRSSRWGFAPRMGLGYGRDPAFGDVLSPYAGFVGSWDPITALGLYGGATFANYWIDGERPDWANTAEGTEVSSSFWGDGVLQLTAGLLLPPRTSAHFHVEYSLLQPAQDDPGDYFHFVQSHLLALGASW